MNKQLVEFKAVQSEVDIQIGEILNTIPKDSLIKVKDTNHLWFNGINLSKQYNISDDKVIKNIVKEDDNLIISFTDDSEDKVIDIHKHLNDIDGGYELQNIIANKHIKIKNQYQSAIGKNEINIPKQDILNDYKIGIKGCYKGISDKYPGGSFLVRTHPTREFKVKMYYGDEGLIYYNNSKHTLISSDTTLDLGEEKEHNILFEVTSGTGFDLQGTNNSDIKHISYIPNKNNEIKAFKYIENEDVEFEIIGKPTSIGHSAFRGCKGFTGELKLPDSLTSIGNMAFNYCEGFTGELVIPESVTNIGDGAFQYCSGFTGELKLPDSLTSIGDNAFMRCKGFTGELVIPESVTNIGRYAFENCTGFTGELVIPDSVEEIGSYAFYNCKGFTSLKLPESLTSIGYRTFGFCSGFTGDLIIPEGVTNIEGYAFYKCSGLSKIYVCEDTELGDLWNSSTQAEVIKYKKGETPWKS